MVLICSNDYETVNKIQSKQTKVKKKVSQDTDTDHERNLYKIIENFYEELNHFRIFIFL